MNDPTATRVEVCALLCPFVGSSHLVLKWSEYPLCCMVSLRKNNTRVIC